MATSRIGPLGLCGAAVWGAAVCLGTGILIDYENSSGAAANAPLLWPEASRIPRTAGRPHLIMFVHPRCPCSRASIGELALIMARGQEHLTANVLFSKPARFDEPWAKSDLWRRAAAISGVVPMLDEYGAEAQQFAAATSGHVVLYDGAGRLHFSGGITISRGHSGDNAGRSAVVALLNRGEAGGPSGSRPIKSSVFGCPLFDDPSESPCLIKPQSADKPSVTMMLVRWKPAQAYWATACRWQSKLALTWLQVKRTLPGNRDGLVGGFSQNAARSETSGGRYRQPGMSER
jgi:hypothetical protein